MNLMNLCKERNCRPVKIPNLHEEYIHQAFIFIERNRNFPKITPGKM